MKKPKLEKTIELSGNHRKQIELLSSQGLDFKVTRTLRTVKISVLDLTRTYRGQPIIQINYLYRKFTDKGGSKKLFSLMKELKEMISERSGVIKHIPYSGNPLDVNLYAFNRNVIDKMLYDTGTIYTIDNVIEADITKAYYRTALNLKLITEDFYNRCLEIPKNDRLRLIGSIATFKTIQHYRKGILQEDMTEIIEDENLREAWFKICSYVDEAMQVFKACLKDNFLFYWVDGIYFRDFDTVEDFVKEAGFSNNIDYIFAEVSKNYNFEWKTQKLQRFELLNKGNCLEINITDSKGRKRPFYPPVDKIVSYNLLPDAEFKF